jgi:hypothetical protein
MTHSVNDWRAYLAQMEHLLALELDDTPAASFSYSSPALPPWLSR